MREEVGPLAIPEGQLEAWSHQGGTSSSARAYASVGTAISSSSALSYRRPDVYLQGSYRNDTNIRGDSDVDIVVHSDATFFFDVTRLSEAEAVAVKSLPAATYTWDQLRLDVLNALVDYFGARKVVDGNKCITVRDPGSSGISADVVPAFTHRLYLPNPTRSVEGIAFFTQRDRQRIVSFPRQHYERGVEKQKATSNEYKPTIRMFKNVRSHLVDTGVLPEDSAPSYFVECLIFNAANAMFVAETWQDQFVQVYNFIDGADISRFLCANGIIPLFGSAQEQWNVESAQLFLWNVKTLWNGW
jgi:hypothetical protein